MLHNNWQRLNIWMGLRNRFDYDEYCGACEQANVKPQPIIEFAERVGLLMVALTMYPLVPLKESYLKLIGVSDKTIKKLMLKNSQEESTQKSKCCGGGKSV